MTKIEELLKLTERLHHLTKLEYGGALVQARNVEEGMLFAANRTSFDTTRDNTPEIDEAFRVAKDIAIKAVARQARDMRIARMREIRKEIDSIRYRMATLESEAFIEAARFCRNIDVAIALFGDA